MLKMKPLSIMIFAFAAGSLLAQSPSSAPPGGSAPTMRNGRGGGCWQQAGISPSVAQQGREIERNLHSQVMSVCADTSLSQEQKREQIHQLREQSLEQVRGLVTEQQAEAYKLCFERRHGGRMMNGRNDPCEEMQQREPSSTQPSNGSDARPQY
jgi:hypothetical protein